MSQLKAYSQNNVPKPMKLIEFLGECSLSEFNEFFLRGSDLERERNYGYTQGSDVLKFDRRKTIVDI